MNFPLNQGTLRPFGRSLLQAPFGGMSASHPMTIRLFRRAAWAALLAAMPALAQLPVVPGEPSRTPKAEATARLRLAPAPTANLALPPVTEAELALVRQANQRGTDRPSLEQRVAIGVVRQGAVDAPSAANLAW